MKPKVPGFETYMRFGRYQLMLSVMYTYWILLIVNTMTMMAFAGKKPTVTCYATSENTTVNATAYSMVKACPFIGTADCASYRMSGVYLATTLQMLCVMIGALICGWASDRWGRKRVLVISWTIIVILTTLSAFSVNLFMFTILRMAQGLVISGMIGSGFCLFVEFMDTNKRFTMSNLFGFSNAFILYGLVAYVAGDWRKLELYSAIIQVPGLLASFWLLDESPRWLIQRGRLDDARTIMLKLARWNKMQVDQIDLDLQIHRLADKNASGQTRNDELEKETMMIDENKILSPRRTYHFYHIFYNWRLSKYSICMGSAWFANSMVSYGLKLNIGNLAGSSYVNVTFFGFFRFAMQLLMLALSLTFPRVGRKPQILVAFGAVNSCCLAAFVIQFMFPGGWVQTLRIVNLAAAGFTAPCWILSTLVTAELYPTPIRAIANGSLAAFCRVAGALAPQVLFLGDMWMPSAPYLVFCIGLTVSMTLMTMFLDETRFSALPEHMPQRKNNDDAVKI